MPGYVVHGAEAEAAHQPKERDLCGYPPSPGGHPGNVVGKKTPAAPNSPHYAACRRSEKDQPIIKLLMRELRAGEEKQKEAVLF